MADDVDQASELIELDTRLAVERALRPFDPGEPGVCHQCDEEWPRLVGGRCAPCRDGSDGFAHRQGFGL